MLEVFENIVGVDCFSGKGMFREMETKTMLI